MSTPSEVTLSTRLQRKDPRLPVFVLIPGRCVRAWKLTGTAVIEGSANEHSFGRRTLKAWGKGTDDWFMEFTTPFCETAGLSVGATVRLSIRLADASTPPELERILWQSQDLNAAWSALSERQRREAREHIRATRTQATRERRAAAIAERLRGASRP